MGKKPALVAHISSKEAPKGPSFRIKMLRCKDGDTFVGLVSVRIAGLRAEEYRDAAGKIIPAGKVAKEMLEAALPKDLTGRIVTADVYGRMVVALDQEILLPETFPYGGKHNKLTAPKAKQAKKPAAPAKKIAKSVAKPAPAKPATKTAKPVVKSAKPVSKPAKPGKKK